MFKMFTIYRNKWTSDLPEEPREKKFYLEAIKAEWAEGLADLTEQSIARGLYKIKLHCEWPPSIAEFRRHALPTPEDLGLPDANTAIKIMLDTIRKLDRMHDEIALRRARCEPVDEAIMLNPWSIPMIKYVVDIIGISVIRQMSDKEIKKEFTAIYLDACKKEGLVKFNEQNV